MSIQILFQYPINSHNLWPHLTNQTVNGWNTHKIPQIQQVKAAESSWFPAGDGACGSRLVWTITPTYFPPIKQPNLAGESGKLWKLGETQDLAPRQPERQQLGLQWNGRPGVTMGISAAQLEIRHSGLLLIIWRASQPARISGHLSSIKPSCNWPNNRPMITERRVTDAHSFPQRSLNEKRPIGSLNRP